MNSSLVKNLNLLINQSNMSLRGLERKAGLKENAIRNILRGNSKKPGYDKLVPIARALNCSVDDLIGNYGISKSVTTPIRDRTYENKILFSKILSYISSHIETLDTNISSYQLLKELDYLYSYFYERKASEVDQDFIKWHLDHIFKGD